MSYGYVVIVKFFLGVFICSYAQRYQVFVTSAFLRFRCGLGFLRRLRLLSSSLSSLARSRYVRPEYQSPGSYRYFQTRGYESASTSFIRILQFFLVKVCREFNKSLLSLEVVGSSTG